MAGLAVDQALGAPVHRTLAVALAGLGSAAVGAYDDLYGTAQARVTPVICGPCARAG